MRARTSLAILLAIAGSTAVVAVGANAANSTPDKAASSSASGESTTPVTTTTPVPVVQSDITNNFVLFRDQPASPIPPDIAARVASSERFGRNADLARSIQTPHGTGWVIPGDHWLCIVMPDPVDGYGESCNPTSTAIERGLWIRLAGDSPDAKASDALLVPDGTQVHTSPNGTTSVGAPAS